MSNQFKPGAMPLPLFGRNAFDETMAFYQPYTAADVEALAERIAASPARCVIPLEGHSMGIGHDLLNPGARNKLIAKDIRHYCSEIPADSEVAAVPTKVLAALRKEPTSVYGEGGKAFKRGSTKELACHAIGATLISHEEAFVDFKKRYPEKSLLEKFIFKAVRKSMNMQANEQVHEAYITLALNQFLQIALESGNPAQLLVDYMNDPVNSNIGHLYRKTGVDTQKLLDDVLDEWDFWQDKFNYARDFGKADELAARRTLSAIGYEDRAVILYGAMHGLIGNNPASLPDQLRAQTLAAERPASSLELLLLVAPASAAGTHKILGEQLAEDRLRQDITVYDYIRHQEWPIMEWYQNAGSMYRSPDYSFTPQLKL